MVRVPITATIREILWPLRGEHPRLVFTFVAERTVDKVIRGKPYKFVKGKRYPMTKDGIRRVWNDVRERAGLAGYVEVATLAQHLGRQIVAQIMEAESGAQPKPPDFRPEWQAESDLRHAFTTTNHGRCASLGD